MTASRMMMFLQDMGMGLFRGGAASDEELADPFGDQRRLVLALDLDRKFERLLPLAGALFVEFNELDMAAHPLARADGVEEADLVAAIVDAHLDVTRARADRCPDHIRTKAHGKEPVHRI